MTTTPTTPAAAPIAALAMGSAAFFTVLTGPLADRLARLLLAVRLARLFLVAARLAPVRFRLPCEPDFAGLFLAELAFERALEGDR